MPKDAKKEVYAGKSLLRKVWYFIWEDNSPLSWIVNIILAFVLIKFIVYPGLGLLLGTSYPIVAVVSGSMEHQGNFDSWWEKSAGDYEKFSITKPDFEKYTMKNGFNKGDIIILRSAEKLKKGDIIVYRSLRPDPIIHRVVAVDFPDGYAQTKGDNFLTNRNQIISYVNINGQPVMKGSLDAIKCLDETAINKDDILGKAWIRIPLLGYVKIFAVDIVNKFR